ncbi:hypothetical protein ONZ45_g18490 [Pleurotus djamor]|nr:hypothetical protein ONZ45_g18490 [Pleurotus djamor]
MKPPPPDASWPRRLLHKAIELFKFYFRGIKLVFTHGSQVRAIHHRIRNGGSPMTREEFRFIRVYSEDIRKLIPFIIIVLIIEEIVPLIAIYAPFMLPSTCVLPSQQERIHSQKQTKAIAYLAEFKETFQQLAKLATESSFSTARLAVSNGPTGVCGQVPLLSLPSSSLTRLTFPHRILRLSTLGPDMLRLRRIRNHLQFIAEDDKLLIQEDMGASLRPDQLRSALEERGLLFSEISPRDQRERLRAWLQTLHTPHEDNVSPRLRYILQHLVSSP